MSELMHNPVGVIGSGSFGTAIANLLSYNTNVLLYSRTESIVETINAEHRHQGIEMSPRIRATFDPQELAESCTLLFPIVPSANFRWMIQNFSPFLKPYHIMIHGTKGLDLYGVEEERLPHATVNRSNVRTMSEVIVEESAVVRVGCLSGPNLATEIFEGQPTATLIASRFTEVIKAGQQVLNSKRFHVFGSHEILGAELAGALKNVIALASGILGGRGMGKNIQAMLITRGLTEMVHFGNALGASSRAFLGTAGIGDLVATATSINSRNYTFGLRLAKGESVEEISASMPEVAEGVRTLKIAVRLARYYKLHVPITMMVYKVVFEGFDIDRALIYLMEYPYAVDVDFV